MLHRFAGFVRQNLLLTFVYSGVFSLLLFVILFFALPREEYTEYIEPVSGESERGLGDDYAELGETSGRLRAYFRSKSTAEFLVDYRYIPSSLELLLASSHGVVLETFSSYFLDQNLLRDGFGVYLYDLQAERRGKMEDHILHMYRVQELSLEEFFSVLVHEFGHYIDIYVYSYGALGDVSDEFYTISWDSITQMKSESISEDFVSGYAMTNKYEDFAESFVYYVLYNEEFLLRAKTNPLLEEKYDFFEQNVFSQGQFQGLNFSSESHYPLDYYWDITKIELNLKKVLQYLDHAYNSL